MLVEIGLDLRTAGNDSVGFGWGVFLYYHGFDHCFVDLGGIGWGELLLPW